MRRLIVLIVALGLVAAACGSSDDSSEQADTPSTTEGTDAPSTTQGPGLTLPPVTNPTVTAAPTTEPPDTGGAPAASPIAVQLAEWSVVAPTNIAAGTVEFGVENLGVFSHEFAIARGDSYETLPQLDNGAVDEQSLGDDFLGKADVIDLGQTTTVSFELEPGTYVLFCNISVGPESHAGEGQVLSVTVTG